MGKTVIFLFLSPCMSLHGRHIIYYTSMIYTMQYAYHICNDIGPTDISISQFWACHMSHKDLS